MRLHVAAYGCRVFSSTCTVYIDMKNDHPLSLPFSYVESFFIALTYIEKDLQADLMSIHWNESRLIKLQSAPSVRCVLPSQEDGLSEHTHTVQVY